MILEAKGIAIETDFFYSMKAFSIALILSAGTALCFTAPY